MTKSRVALLVWAPRMAGLALSLFLGLFALDAFNGQSLLHGMGAFAVHLLPALIVLCAVALAWRLPLAGAAAFALLAIGYGVMVGWRLDWVAVIAGPMAGIAALFVLSWRLRTAG